MCSCGINTPCYGGCPCGCTHTGPVDAKPTDVLSDYARGQRDALAGAIQRVEALWIARQYDADWITKPEVVAAIKGESE